jgi:anti-sigma B factor antagonist
MELSINENNGVKVIQIEGNLDTSTSPKAETQINDMINNGELKMVIDLSGAGFVSSAGLRVFLSTAKQVTAKGGAVKFCGANEVVQEILDISGFSGILDVKPSLDDALSTF